MVVKRTSRAKADERLNDWRHRGPEAAFFQREAQVNLWTVLGGLAAGALLTQLPDLWADVLAGRWHLLLYAVATLLVIVNSWVLSAWGSLAMRWRLSAYGTLYYFLGLFSLSLVGLAVRTPALWFTFIGLNLVSMQIVQQHFKSSGTWALYSAKRIRSIRRTNVIYIVWIVTAFSGAAQMYWLPSRASEIAWGVFALVSGVFALHLQHVGMEGERRELGIP